MMPQPHQFFSLISHAELGFNSELDTFLTSRTMGRAAIKNAVNIATGNLIVEDKKYQFIDRGCSQNLSMIYNSKSAEWKLSFSRSIKKAQNGIYVQEPDGKETLYCYDEKDKAYYPQDLSLGRHRLTIENDNSYKLIDVNKKSTEIFSNNGQLSEKYDNAKNCTVYHYNNLSKISKITLASGDEIEFEYSNHSINVYFNQEKVRNHLHHYKFNTQGKLEESITNDQYQVVYRYNHDGYLAEVEQSDKTKLGFNYTPADHAYKVSELRAGNEDQYCIHYLPLKSELTHPSGDKVSFEYNEHCLPASFTLDDLNVTYVTDNHGRITSKSYPDGSKEEFEYETFGQVKCITKRDKTQIQFKYEFIDNIPYLVEKRIIDKDKKLIASYHHVYEDGLLRFTIEPSGKVFENKYDEFGQVIKKNTYLQNKYPVNHLLNKISLQDVLDWQKNLIKPSCSIVNFERNKKGQVDKITQGNSETNFRYDLFNNIKRKEIKLSDDATKVDQFEYSSLNELIKLDIGVNTNLKQTSHTVFDKNICNSLFANGLQKITTQNKAGLITSIDIQSDEAQKNHQQTSYIPTERKIVETNAAGNKTFKFYDLHDRVTTSISPTGIVNHKNYNAKYRYEESITYANLIDSNILPSLTLKAKENLLKDISDPFNDRRSYKFFDSNGNVKYQVDANLNIIKFDYDELGHQIADIRFKQPILKNELTALLSGQDFKREISQENARITREFYKDGLKVATQDANGYVVLYNYDAAGRLTSESAFVDAIKLNDNIDSLLASLEDKTSSDKFYFYNEMHQCVQKIDPLGFVTEFEYRCDGKIASKRKCAEKVDQAWFANPKTKPEIPYSSKDRIKKFHYDELGRLNQTEDSRGKKKLLSYEKNTNNITHTECVDARNESHVSGDTYRGEVNRFNGKGQLIAKCNAYAAAKLAKIEKRNDLDFAEKNKLKEQVWENEASRFVYNDAGLKIAEYNAKGHRTLYYFDLDGRPKYTIDARGGVIENEYNAFGEVEKITQHYAPISSNKLKLLKGGYVTKPLSELINQLPDKSKNLVETKTYDLCGNIKHTVNASGNKTSYKYNTFNECILEKLPKDSNKLRTKINYKYDDKGQLREFTKSGEKAKTVVKTNIFDFQGKITDELNESGGHLHRDFNLRGDVIKISKKINDADENHILEEINEIDAFSRPIAKVDSSGNELNYTYNDATNTETCSIPKLNSKETVVKNVHGDITSILIVDVASQNVLKNDVYSHDEAGHVSVHKNIAGHSIHTIRDCLGLKEKEIDANGIETVFAWNETQQLQKKTIDSGGLNNQTTYEPNIFGQNEKVIDARGIELNTQFDKSGKIASSIRDKHLMRKKSYQYNQLDLPEWIIEGEGDNKYVVKMEYNGYGQLIKKIVDPKTPERPQGMALTTEFEYDAQGNVIKETDPNGVIKRKFYNCANLLTYEVTEHDKTNLKIVSYNYNKQGELFEIHTHHQTIPQSKVTDVSSLKDINELIVNDSLDSVTQYYYEHGHQKFKLSINGDSATVLEFDYDGLNRITRTAQYSEFLDLKSSDSVTTESIKSSLAKIANPSKDVIKYYAYNDALNTRTTIDQDGFVKFYKLDQSGRVILRNEYHNSCPENKRTKHYFYDNLGRKIFVIRQNGQIIGKEYDANSNVTHINKYAEILDSKLSRDELLKTLKSLSPCSRTTSVYNNADVKIEHMDEAGHKEYFHRNQHDALIKYLNKAGHTYEYEYDNARRLFLKRSPTTTVTQIKVNDDGYLTSEDKKIRVEQEFKFDNAGNTVAIIEGKGLPDQRVVELGYTPHNQSNSITIKATVDDHSDYHEDWIKLKHLPEKSVELNAFTVFNTKKQKVVEKNESGGFNYHVYNSLEQEIYRITNSKAVTHFSYDALGKVIKEKSFSIPVSIKHDDFPQGITLADIGMSDENKKVKIFPSNQDRTTSYAYYRSGELKKIVKDQVLCYEDGKLEMASPTTQLIYNKFGEKLVEASLIANGKWAEQFYFYDNFGRIIGKVDEENYLTKFDYNDSSARIYRRTEYALPLIIKIDQNSSWNNITKNIVTRKSIDKTGNILNAYAGNCDREIIYTYNKQGKVLSETQVDVLASQVSQDENGKPIVNKFITDIAKYSEYTPTGKLASFVDEMGNKTEYHYDERDFLIAKVDPERQNEHDNSNKIRPLTRHKVNAFGNTVVTQTSQDGCQTENNGLPSFVGNVHENLCLFDNRNLLAREQDAEGHLKLYTYHANRIQARKITPFDIWHPIHSSALINENHLSPESTSSDNNSSAKAIFNPPQFVYKGKENGWVEVDKPHNLLNANSNPATNFVKSTHIDENRTELDDYGRVHAKKIFREGFLDESDYFIHNNFDELIGKGKSAEKIEEIHRLDKLGRGWLTPNKRGADTINLHNLKGNQTLSINAPALKLTDCSYDYQEIKNLVDQHPLAVPRTESMFDRRGLLTANKSPIWYRNSADLPSKQYSHDHWGNVLSMIDSLGNTTDYSFNHFNGLMREVQPAVNVDVNGEIVLTRPVKEHAYRLDGLCIADINPKSNMTVYGLNEVGQELNKILADGSCDSRSSWDAQGNQVSYTDARDEKWVFDYSPANHLTTSILPSGRKIKREYNQKGSISLEVSPSGKETRYNPSSTGRTWECYMPNGNRKLTNYDRHGVTLLQKNADGTQISNDVDYFGNVLTHCNLSGEVFINDYDFAKNIIHEYLDPATAQPRNSMSAPWDYQIGIFINNNRPVSAYHNHFNPTIHATIPKNINHKYEYGLLKQSIDSANGTILDYDYTSESMPYYLRLGNSSYGLLREITTTFDALKRDVFTKNTFLPPLWTYGNAEMQKVYDVNDNITQLNSKVSIPGFNDGRIHAQRYDYAKFSYDLVDRIKKIDGNNGNTNREFGYLNNYRDKESDGSRGQNNTLLRSADGIVYGFRSVRGDASFEEVNDLDADNFAVQNHQKYENFYPPIFYNNVDALLKFEKHQRLVIDNANIKKEVEDLRKYYHQHKSFIDENSHTETVSQLLPFNELSGHVNTVSDASTAVRDSIFSKPDKFSSRTETDVTNDYVSLDEHHLSRVRGFKRVTTLGKDKHEHKPRVTSAEASQYYDANGILNGKQNSSDEPFHSTFFLTTPKHTLLDKQNLQPCDHLNNAGKCGSYHYIMNSLEELNGGFLVLNDLPEKIKNVANVNDTPNLVPDTSAFVHYIAPRPLAKDTPNYMGRDFNTPLLLDETPTSSLGPRNYYTKPGDTLESIALNTYGDASLGTLLGLLNGMPSAHSTLMAGQCISIFPLETNFNTSKTHRAYDDFLAIMAGSLSPAFVMPKEKRKHPNYVFIAIEVLIVALIIVSAPHLAHLLVTTVLPQLVGATLTAATMEAILTSVIAGFSDAAFQGLAIHYDFHEKFSWSEVFNTALLAGMAPGPASSANFFSMQHLEQLGLKAVQTGMASLAQQLFEMKIGARDEIDLKAIMAQIASVLAASEITKYVNKPLIRAGYSTTTSNMLTRLGTSTSNALIGHKIMHTPIDIKAIAAGFIGESIADGITSQFLSETEEKAAPKGKKKETHNVITLAHETDTPPPDTHAAEVPEDYELPAFMTAPRFGDEANRQAIDDNIYRNDNAGYTSDYPQIPEFISQKLQPLVNTIDHQMVNLDHAATGVAHSSLMNNMMSFDQWFYNTTEPGVRRVFDVFEKYGPPLGPTVQTLGGVAGLAGAILGTAASGPFSWATALSLGSIAGASIDQIETGLYGVYKGYTQPSNLRTASGLVGFSETSQDRIEFARDLASGGKEALTKGIHLFGLMKPSTLKLAGKERLVPTAKELAEKIASSTGQEVVPLSGKGYKIQIPHGNNRIVARVMEEAGGRKNYYRISIDGKQSFTKLGEVSSDRSLTHINIEATSHEDLMNIIKRIINEHKPGNKV